MTIERNTQKSVRQGYEEDQLVRPRLMKYALAFYGAILLQTLQKCYSGRVGLCGQFSKELAYQNDLAIKKKE